MDIYRPRLLAARPADWFVKESLTLLAPDGQANVIISSEPLEPSMSVTDYATIQGSLLAREFPGYREFSFGPAVVFGQFPGYIRDFAWTPPDGVNVTQIQCYFVQDGRGFTGTATTPTTWFAEREFVLRDILLSATVSR